MKYTANLKLKKPEGTDVVNINDLNDNVDILDREITQVKDKANNINAGDIKLSYGKTIEGKFTEVQGSIGNINDLTLPVELKGKSLIEQTKQLFQSGLDGKNLLETSIKSKGGTVSKQGTVATFNELDLGIKSIETDNTGDATAVVGDILSGKTAYVKGKKLTGTMPNRGAIDNTITTQGGQITIPAGYHNGSGKVKAQFPNLLAENIKKDVNIGGVVGDYEGEYTVRQIDLISEYQPEIDEYGIKFTDVYKEPIFVLCVRKSNSRYFIIYSKGLINTWNSLWSSSEETYKLNYSNINYDAYKKEFVIRSAFNTEYSCIIVF